MPFGIGISTFAGDWLVFWCCHRFRSWVLIVSIWVSIASNCWQTLAMISSRLGSCVALIACQWFPCGMIARLFVGHSGAVFVVIGVGVG